MSVRFPPHSSSFLGKKAQLLRPLPVW